MRLKKREFFVSNSRLNKGEFKKNGDKLNNSGSKERKKSFWRQSWKRINGSKRKKGLMTKSDRLKQKD